MFLKLIGIMILFVIIRKYLLKLYVKNIRKILKM
jgi:hypothetical protein